MLQTMRKHAKYFYVLFFIVILTFIFWGVGDVDNGVDQAGKPLAVVAGEEITTEEYWRAYDNMENTLRDVYREKFDQKMRDELKARVLDMLVTERVLVAAAREAGLRVSDREVEDSIVSDPNFIRDGAFRKDIYERTLQLNRITPQTYEEYKRESLLAEKMRRMIEASVELTPAELAQLPKEEEMSKLLKDVILQTKQERALDSFVNGMRARLKIEINEGLIS